MPGNNVADFADAIQEKERIGGRDNLGLFPTPEQMIDPTTLPADTDSAHAGPKIKYSAHYGRFNIDRDSERLEIERVQNHILNDGWLLAREEWVTTDEGDTIVTLKWLQPGDDIRKAIAEAQARDEEASAKKSKKT